MMKVRVDDTNKGKAWVLGNDVSTDDIIPGRFLEVRDHDKLASHAFIDLVPGFVTNVQPGDIIIAGENFGCGSSREQAPRVLYRLGIGSIHAVSFARIFYRNAFNLGLPLFTVPRETVGRFSTGNAVRYSVAPPVLENVTTGHSVMVPALPPFFLEMVRAGGALPALKARLAREQVT